MACLFKTKQCSNRDKPCLLAIGTFHSSAGQCCFEELDAPVKRVASMDTPIPFAKELEDGFLAKSRLAESIDEVLNY